VIVQQRGPLPDAWDRINLPWLISYILPEREGKVKGLVNAYYRVRCPGGTNW
jgi:hypothetical protein